MNDGPKLKKIYTCEGCRWLVKTYKNTYACMHPNTVGELNIYNIFLGNIKSDLKTPSFCPAIHKKLRKEKIKKINEIKKMNNLNEN